MKHAFIFSPGIWVGEGKITFSASSEVINFFTRWETSSKESEMFSTQQVQMQDIEDKVINYFRFFDIAKTSFSVELENDLVGSVIGKGIISANELAWEFRGHASFEGFEVYCLKKEGDYSVHAEFSSPEQFRTIIEGRVWRSE